MAVPVHGGGPWPAGSPGRPLPRRCDIFGEPFPYVAGGDEAAGRPAAWVGGPVEMFENLSPKIAGHQRAECAGGRVADEVKVADLLCDDAHSWAGTESLYLWAEDLTESHILEIQGRSWRRPPLGGTAFPPPR